MQQLKRKTTDELMWPYVLRLLHERPMYVYEIRQKIQERFGWKPPLVTSYTVLYRLNRKKYVTIKWRQQRGKPARKYYKITAKGRKLMRQAKEYFDDLYEKLFKQ